MSKSGIHLVVGAAVAACLAGSGCAEGPSAAEGHSPTRSLQAASGDPARPMAPAELRKGFVGNIDRLTTSNENYRQVLYTGKHLQLVLMSLKPGEEIGEETHESTDQFFRVEAGQGEIVINGVTHRVEADSAMLVPAGARHNLRNTGTEPLKVYTPYGPPEHRRDVVQATKAEAEAQPLHFDGTTTE